MTNLSKNEKIARESIFKKSENLNGKKIRGYDFNSKFNFENLISSFETTGAQASNLFNAIRIIKKMKKEKAFIYLGYTSNMVTTGIREVIKYLVQNKKIDMLVTTAGGIEEDFMKCFGDFKLGNFNASGKELRKRGINRAGNIFIPNSLYCNLEDFVLPILEKYKNKTITPSYLIKELAKKINNPESIYYWAEKNNIPVYCPAIMDGGLGDIIYFFKSNNPEFNLDVSEDARQFNNSTMGKDKTGMIILGSGVIKHAICNANMFRNGADYTVYINNSQEFDGSDSGAAPDEAVSWGKIKPNSEENTVKIFGDATILFPIIVGFKAFEN